MADYPDFEGGKSKLFTVADWAAVEATDKNFSATGTDKWYSESIFSSYTIPSGKTLYITQFAWGAFASDSTEGDLNQICEGMIWSYTDQVRLWTQAGNGGGGLIFPKPLVVTGGKLLRFINTAYANHSMDLSLAAGGYEV